MNFEFSDKPHKLTIVTFSSQACNFRQLNLQVGKCFFEWKEEYTNIINIAKVNGFDKDFVRKENSVVKDV